MTKILFVDPDAALLEQGRRQLQTRAFQVVTATDGFTAVTAAQIDQPAIILLGARLPGINGWQVVELLKASAFTQQIPIIGLAAPGQQEDVQRLLAAGCDHHLEMPVCWPDLLAQIDSFLPNGDVR